MGQPELIARLLRARRSRLGGECRELVTAEGRAREPPTPLCCLSEYHPGATGLGRIAGDLGDNLGDLFDELLLALAGQRRWRSDDLNADGASGIGGGGVNRVRVHSMDKSCGVVQMEGARSCHTFSVENGHREFLAKPTVGASWEKVGRGINVNHGHSKRQSGDETGYIPIAARLVPG